MKNANKSPLDIMQKNAGKAEALLKQLANANRLLILCNILEGGRSVNDISQNIGLSQSAVSQHLASMKEAGIISHEKRGKLVYYNISSMETQTILSILYHMYCK